MQRNLIILTLGFVIGIASARGLPIELPALAYMVIAAAMISILAVFFYIKGQPLGWALFFAGFLIGAANFTYHSSHVGENHLLAHIREETSQSRTKLYGVITKEPEIRERYTRIIVKPTFLEKSGSLRKVPIDGGLVQIQVYPSIGRVYDQLAYGAGVIVSGGVTQPAPPNNPGLLDMRASLRNQGIHAAMSVRKVNELEVQPGGVGNPLVRLALWIKEHMLFTIKKTVRYPESSFLGGVLLGLRSGLSREVQDAFRAAGVSHVLAVSGLHVTIITALFVSLFSIVRIPRKITGPSIIFLLILFTIITGARPSTVRAAIMNSVGLLGYYLLGMGVRTSLLFSISIAALVILIPNPLILVEASFLFSFSAVLSLGLMTGPIDRLLLRRLRSFTSVAIGICGFVVLGSFINDPKFYVQPPRGLLFCLGSIPLAFLLDRVIPHKDVFRSLPFWLRSFTSAQLAIQLGMGPLSVFYFTRLSLSAPMANFIAIPLIGVIVQLGVLAGIIDFIPLIGQPLALLLGAVNWLLVKVFLGSATFFADAIPYPYVQQPTPLFFIAYYGGLALFIWHEMIIRTAQTFFIHLRKTFHSYRAIKVRLFLTLAAGLAAAAFSIVSYHQSRASADNLRLIIFDPSVFKLGAGGAVLVSTPTGKQILIDGCPREVEMSDRVIPFDLGEMLLLPALMKANIAELDLVCTTSPDPARTGGLVSILKNIPAAAYFDALPQLAGDAEQFCPSLLSYLADSTWDLPKNRDYVQRMCTTYRDLTTQLASAGITRIAKPIPCTLLEEKSSDPRTPHFTFEAIYPSIPREEQPYATQVFSTVYRVRYGNFTALICPELSSSGQEILVQNLSDNLKCDLMIPSHLALPTEETDHFLTATDPKWVVFQYRSNRTTNRIFRKTLQRFEASSAECYRTDKCGAVIVTTDGETTTFQTMLPCSEPKATI